MSDARTVRLSQLLMAAGFKVSEFYGPNAMKITVDLFAHFSFPLPKTKDDYYGAWDQYPGFQIFFPGFGMKEGLDDKDSAPVMVEYRAVDGENFPNVCIWPDINKPDAIVTTLEYAALDKREPGTEQPRPKG